MTVERSKRRCFLTLTFIVKLTSYIAKHDFLNSSQYGFRKGHSFNAIPDIVNDIQSNMNRRLLSCGVFIDLKKAFDTVDHDVNANFL